MLLVGVAFVSLLMMLNMRAALKFRAYVSGLSSEPLSQDEELKPISVIIPCKGDDGRLFANLQSLLDQDYPDVEFVLVTALDEDLAQRVFARLRAAYPDRRIKAMVAGITPYGSEKNNNLIKAVAASDPSTEILVFLDSDGKSNRRLLKKLVSGLRDSSVAAVSGYRWYEPRWNILPEVIRTAWNAGTFCFLSDPQTSFVWGGGMAIRRKTYEESGIVAIWAKRISDDITLSIRLKQLGLKIKFLPACVVLSNEKDGWRSLLRWANRQIANLRFDHPKLFWIEFLEYTVGNMVGLGLLIWSCSRGFTGITAAAGLVGLLWFVHFWFFAALVLGPIETILRVSEIDVRIEKCKLIFIVPLASILQAVCGINALFVSRIHWAGITYEIHDGVAKRL